MSNFIIAVVLVVALAKLLSEVMEHIGLTSMLGEFGAGIILGVSFMGLVAPGDIEIFATMGVIILMFMAGYEETDVNFLLKEEKKIGTIAIVGLAGTLSLMYMFFVLFMGFTPAQALFGSFIFTLTDTAVGAKVLLSTKKIHTRIGETLLGVAVVDTILGIILLALGVAAMTSQSFESIAQVALGIALFFAILIFSNKVLPKLITATVKLRTEEVEFSVAFLSVFLLAFLAEELGLASILGAYFAGIILQKSGELETDHFNTTLRSMGYGFFIPLFFAWVGLSTNVWLVPVYLKPALMITGAAIIIKFLVIASSSMFMKSGLKESVIYGFGMCAKGADNLIILAIGLSLGVLGGLEDVLTTAVFVTMTVSVVLSSIALSKLLR